VVTTLILLLPVVMLAVGLPIATRLVHNPRTSRVRVVLDQGAPTMPYIRTADGRREWDAVRLRTRAGRRRSPPSALRAPAAPVDAGPAPPQGIQP